VGCWKQLASTLCADAAELEKARKPASEGAGRVAAHRRGAEQALLREQTLLLERDYALRRKVIMVDVRAG
jgi:hypothetical protein